jgi:hypothetical protein
MNMLTKHNRGAVDGWMISTIGLIVLVLGLGSLAIWALLNYQEQKTNVDGKVDAAVAEARRDQSEIEQNKFLEEEKNPRREFAGPDDYGRLSFTYPKTWSVYEASDISRGGDFSAFLHPITVPSTSVKTQQFALRVQILQENYDKYLKDFDNLIEDGKLRSSTVSVNGENGVRLDGNFSDEIRGAAVIFKIRDKTAVLRTDADTFKPDFETLIKTVTFVK